MQNPHSVRGLMRERGVAESIELEEGDTISGKVHCHRRKDNSRHLDILLEYALTRKGSQQSGEVKFQNYSLC